MNPSEFRDLLMWRAGLLCVGLTCCGCGQRSPDALVAVSGRLMSDEKPVANANLAFHRVATDRSSVDCPVAITNPKGGFELTSQTLRSGIPAGEYVVTVVCRDPIVEFDECECPDPLQHDLFNGRYGRRDSSPLRVQIAPASGTRTCYLTLVVTIAQGGAKSD